jgi:hypothetical protein
VATFTIITTTATFGIEGDRWARDDDGDCYVYEDGQPDPVATVDSAQFVAILRTAPAAADAGDLADIAPGLTADIERAVRDALHDAETPLTGPPGRSPPR